MEPAQDGRCAGITSVQSSGEPSGLPRPPKCAQGRGSSYGGTTPYSATETVFEVVP